MKLLLWHCERLSYVDGKPSTRPEGIHQVAPTPTSGSFNDLLVVFTTVESGDGEANIERATQEIQRMIKMIGERLVLLMPFAHLSNDLAEEEQATGAIAEIARRLAQGHSEVVRASFGFHKEDFELSYVANGHPGSVAYREA